MEWMKILAPVIIGLLAIIKIWYNSKKKNEENMSAIVSNITETNEILVTALRDNGDLLRVLNTNFMLINETIIINNNNSANIMKDCIFTKFGKSWCSKMYTIFLENNIQDIERTINKIDGATNTLLKNSFDRCNVIEGLHYYLPEFDSVIDILDNQQINEKVLELFQKCKVDHDVLYLKQELNSLFETTYSFIDSTEC